MSMFLGENSNGQNRNDNSSERLKRMVENDEFSILKKALKVAQSDVMSVLCEFMDAESIDMRVVKNGDRYILSMVVEVNKFYDVGTLSEGI